MDPPPVRTDALERPSSRRLASDHPRRSEILAAHAAAIRDGAPVYRDPASGLAVFTARFLVDRGYCCGSGCRHCPFVDASRPH